MARSADLDAVRRAVAEAVARFPADPDDPWARAARDRLTGIEAALMPAAGGLPAWARRATEPIATFTISWAVAAAATALGLPGPLVIVVTVIVLLVALWGVWVGGNLLDRRLARRRAGQVRPVVDRPADGDLAAVREELLDVRVRLVSAGLRRVDSRHWRAPYLIWRMSEDRPLRCIAHADLLLCQAIDYLERCLAGAGTA